MDEWSLLSLNFDAVKLAHHRLKIIKDNDLFWPLEVYQ